VHGWKLYVVLLTRITVFPSATQAKKDTFSPPNCFEEFILANDDSLLAKSMLFYLYANM